MLALTDVLHHDVQRLLCFPVVALLGQLLGNVHDLRGLDAVILKSDILGLLLLLLLRVGVEERDSHFLLRFELFSIDAEHDALSAGDGHVFLEVLEVL